MPTVRELLNDPQFYAIEDIAKQRELLEGMDPAFKGLKPEEFSQIIETGKRMQAPAEQDLWEQHSFNEQLEAAAQADVERVKGWGQLAAGGLRAAGGLVPGAMVVADPLAQAAEMAAGTRQSYNPLVTAVETGFSAIPGMGMARQAKQVGSVSRGLLRGAARTMGGMAHGGAYAAMADVAEGRTPSPERVATGALMGGAVGGAASAARGMARLPGIRAGEAGARAERAMGKMDHVARNLSGIDINPANVREALPFIAQHVLERRGKYKILDFGDLRNMANETVEAFEARHLEPTSRLSANELVDISPIMQAYVKHSHATSTPKEILKDTSMMFKRLGGSQYAPVSFLERVRKQLNAELYPVQAKMGLAQVAALSSEEAARKYGMINAIRSALADHWAQTTGDPNMRAKLEVFKSLLDVSNGLNQSLKVVEKAKLQKAAGLGKQGLGDLAAKVAAMGMGQYSKTGAINEADRIRLALKSDPDIVASSMFEDLERGKHVIPFLKPAGKKALAQPMRWRGPAATGQRLLSSGPRGTYMPDVPGSPRPVHITPEPFESMQDRLMRESAAKAAAAGQDPYAPFRTSTGNVRRQLPPASGEGVLPMTPEKGRPFTVKGQSIEGQGEGIIMEAPPKLRMPGRGGVPRTFELPAGEEELAGKGFPPVPSSSFGLTEEEFQQLQQYFATRTKE